MAIRNISLTDALDRYVDERIQSGAFVDASEVVSDALRLHKAHSEAVALKTQRLWTLIQEGINSLNAGDSEIVDDLDAWFAGIEFEIDAKSADRGV